MTVRELVALLIEQHDMGRDVLIYDESRDSELQLVRVDVSDRRFPTLIVGGDGVS